jgi:hypothetical protein
MFPEERIKKWIQLFNLEMQLVSNPALIEKFVIKGYLPANDVMHTILQFDARGDSTNVHQLFKTCLYYLEPENTTWGHFIGIKSPNLLRILCEFYSNKANLLKAQSETHNQEIADC